MKTAIPKRDPLLESATEVPGYPQTFQRWPSQPLHRRPQTLSELTGPQTLMRRLSPVRADLAGHGDKRALGQLMHLNVRVVDEDGAPVPGAVVELWHCNAAGKYIHQNDTHDAPVDPNFHGAARVVTGDSGAFTLRSIKPAAYPVPDSGKWWRPPHVHFSVWGKVWLSRLVTQMYFPNEPLNAYDRILNAVADGEARERCIARLVPLTEGPDLALAYDYTITVRGRTATPGMP